MVGIGQTPITKQWDVSVRTLAAKALKLAAKDAGIDQPEALFVGNMLASRLGKQSHLGALIADAAGWRGIEATTLEAACGSGGVAFQAGVRAVASGMIHMAAVCGVEKMTEGITNGPIIAALASAADAVSEGGHGASFVALNALVMRRYMYEYRLPHEAFAPFAINAHRNALNNPNAMFRMAVTADSYEQAPMIADPVNLFDTSPICDGAAAIILVSGDMMRHLNHHVPIRVLASANATDALALADRPDPLDLSAVRLSAQKAYAQAKLKPQNIDVFELHDAFSIMAALSLEASGFAETGRATYLAQDGEIGIDGCVPICTMGGLKGRGHPVGATGIYELVDVVTQLRGEAGKNQVPKAAIGMAQNIGGTAATVVTHILGREV